MTQLAYADDRVIVAPARGATAINGPAIAALACGLAAFTTMVLALPVGLAAIVTGHFGLRHATRIGVGKATAVWGLVLGYLSVAAVILATILFMVNAAVAMYQLAQTLEAYEEYYNY